MHVTSAQPQTKVPPSSPWPLARSLYRAYRQELEVQYVVPNLRTFTSLCRVRRCRTALFYIATNPDQSSSHPACRPMAGNASFRRTSTTFPINCILFIATTYGAYTKLHWQSRRDLSASDVISAACRRRHRWEYVSRRCEREPALSSRRWLTSSR